ncbi:DUF927 domain-containing protein [Methanococcoides sp. AM1]|uniref:DUF927 domain-containing protein n=1 Tax=Methanococcoides sp. AM1 TaxID=1201011 RepID=UPI00108258E5|nr:DUF927 domain-containing protein [Methanococcoides sp. AM1]
MSVDEIKVDEMEGNVLTEGKVNLTTQFFDTPCSMPDGYSVGSRYIREIRYDKEGSPILDENSNPVGYEICETPCMLTGYSSGIDDNEPWLEVTFYDIFGKEHNEWIKQKEVFTRKGIFENLISKGFVTDEKDAGKVTKYFRKCLQSNSSKGTLRQGIVAVSNGWKEDNDCFVYGHKLYCTTGTKEVILKDSDVEDLLAKKGTIQDWVNGNRGLLVYPKVRFVCYAVMTSLLLELLSVQSFIVDLPGSTSTGKTAMSFVAMSHIGNPQKLQNKGESTVASVEENAKKFSDLPLYYDETTNSSDSTLQAIVYTIANETEKGRAKKDGGLREKGSWKNVAITNGEKPIINYDGNTGQFARVIELYGGIGQSGIKEAVDESKHTNKNNYGHIAELFIAKIFQYRKELNKWFRKYKAQFPMMDNDINNRLIDYFAAITVAGRLLEEVYNDIGIERVNPSDVTNEIYEEAVLKNPVKDQAIVALEKVHNWMGSHTNHFINEINKSNEQLTIVAMQTRTPVYGWYCKSNGITYIDFNQAEVSKFLKSEGVDPNYAYHYWKEHEITEVSKAKHGKDIVKVAQHFDCSRQKKVSQRTIRIEITKLMATLEIELPKYTW